MPILDLFSLAGRRALVTGGNRGPGLAFVQALIEAGADVAFIARDGERNASAISGLGRLGLTARRSRPTSLHQPSSTRRWMPLQCIT